MGLDVIVLYSGSRRRTESLTCSSISKGVKKGDERGRGRSRIVSGRKRLIAILMRPGTHPGAASMDTGPRPDILEHLFSASFAISRARREA